MITIPAPMQAPDALRPAFTDPDWLYELKFDGYRCLAGIEADDHFRDLQPRDQKSTSARVQLLTKSGADCTAWYPEVVDALAALPGGPHVLDGEVCVLVDGVSNFNRLQARGRSWKPGRDPVTFCAFDMPVHDGQRVMELPLVQRKQLLEELVAERPGILFVKDLPADAALFQSMTLPPPAGLGLKIEGVMAKRKASTYQPGVRSPDWLKIKRPGWREGRIWKS